MLAFLQTLADLSPIMLPTIKTWWFLMLTYSVQYHQPPLAYNEPKSSICVLQYRKQAAKSRLSSASLTHFDTACYTKKYLAQLARRNTGTISLIPWLPCFWLLIAAWSQNGDERVSLPMLNKAASILSERQNCYGRTLCVSYREGTSASGLWTLYAL